MQISINKQNYQFDENTSLENAITSLELKELNGIALALNEEIIPRSEWQKTILFDEDKIIIIGAVAGG
jgi:sulfur carrier protein